MAIQSKKVGPTTSAPAPSVSELSGMFSSKKPSSEEEDGDEEDEEDVEDVEDEESLKQ